MELERVPTGIKDFDGLIDGGLPSGSINLLTGTPGTAKTIFGLQFIANGAEKYGEKGVFITFEQNTDSLIRQLSSFGYDLRGLIEKGMVRIIEVESGMGASRDPFEQILDRGFIDELKKFNPKRVVLDSISLVINLSAGAPDNRRAVGEIGGLFRSLGATTVFTHERISSSLGNLEYSMEEFLADSIIHLQLEMTEDLLKRFLTVIKMRETNQSTGIYEFKIDESGIKIRNLRNT